jgi:glycyl-tRNA synthetase beta chain
VDVCSEDGDDAKEYLAATSVKAGRSAAEGGAAGAERVGEIYWAKNMYWRPGKRALCGSSVDDGDAGAEVVPVSFGRHRAGAVTRASVLFGDAAIAGLRQYEDALLSGFVVRMGVRRQDS